jgi:hypothetical protein
MAARARLLGDTGESRPELWEEPLGSPDVHVLVTALAPDNEHLERSLEGARQAYQKLPGITAIWRQDVMLYRLRKKHSASKTESVTPRSKEVAFPAPILTSVH